MSAAPVLVSRPPAPQSVPPESRPVHTAEPAYNTGEHSSSGLATSGFRTAKYLLEEWAQAGLTSCYRAAWDRDSSERGRQEAKRLAAECEARAARSQADATRELGRRLQELHGWRAELEREVRDLSVETELLLRLRDRLQRALHCTDCPSSIARDNVQSRERRPGGELVRDGPETQLLTEVELIKNVQDLLRRTLEQTIQQIRQNRDAKEKLEMDWSDKVEAYDIDNQCGRYNNHSTDIQFHHNSSKFEDNTSTPESWAQYSHENIYRGERERMASINLRALVESILQDTAEDLRAQCDAVNAAFANRCEEVEDVKRKQEDHLRKTLKEIGGQENNIAALKQAIKDKEAPMKVAQTRLYQRSYRPNVELCRDPVQFRLVSEVGELTESVEFLKQKLEEAEQSLRNLEDTRMSLEKDIANKANALFIDREKCMTLRTRYPEVIKLSGFQ